MTTVQFDPNEEWDNLHRWSPPDVHWSTDNVGEAVPGIQSPLSASIWSDEGERATRATFVGTGAYPRSELGFPDKVDDRLVGVFCGRMALLVEGMTTLGDRLPGTSGQDIAMSIFGTVPDDIEYRPTKRRYPIIAWKLSRTFFGMPKRLEREPPKYQQWWRRSIDALESADGDRARLMLPEALREFLAALELQSIAVSGHAQIVYQMLADVVKEAGVGDMSALGGAGGAELGVITDIWRASRGELTIEQVIAQHGFHGPLEGEVASTVWREDPTPLEHIIKEYAGREDPRRGEQEKLARLPEAQAEVLAALPRSKRFGAKRTLKMAARRVPMRGIAKRSFLQGLDVIRACARKIGADLAEKDVLDDPEDAFYLTKWELLEVPVDAKELVAKRRERREEYRRISIPGAWKGLPEATAIEETDGERPSSVQGIGVSTGVVEGVARVVTDPSFAEVEADEVLIAPTTDPSWASIMYVSSALVVDMGGPISHAAVVARELGLPCVVNTRSGTRDIRTGDRVRVDGDSGTVEILEPGS
jgi:rifampicin phosphotransferase